MKMRFLSSVRCLSLLLVCLCAAVSAAEPAPSYRVAGLVVDGLGRPLGQVELRFQVWVPGAYQTKLKLQTKADGTYAGELIGPVPELALTLSKDGYGTNTTQYGPLWREYKNTDNMQNARLVLRKPTTLAQIEHLAKLNDQALDTAVWELLASDYGHRLIIDQNGLLDALFHLELHVWPALRVLVKDQYVGGAAQTLLKFFADPADADLFGTNNPFKPVKPVAATTLEEAIRAVMTDAQSVGWPAEYKVLRTTLNEDGTKAFVRALSGGVLGEWYIFCFHKEQDQWVLKSAFRTWRA